MPKKSQYIAVAIILSILTIAELMIYPKLGFSARIPILLTLMVVKALLVALIYMNLQKEGIALQLAFFLPIPVAIYFLLFLLYDAAYVWRS